MNILFVCNQNQNRSKRAEKLFSTKFSTKSAGLYNDVPLSEEELAWADTVFVMEEEQGDEIAKRFPKLYLQKRILCLNIPDIYDYTQEKLKRQLLEKMQKFEGIM